MIAFVCDLIETCLFDQQTRELYLNQSQLNGKYDLFSFKNNVLILALLAINRTSYDKLMNHLRIDGPILNVIETQSSVYPMWYHGDENTVIYAFNSIKEAILVNNDILYEEISVAKRSHNNHEISKLFVTRE